MLGAVLLGTFAGFASGSRWVALEVGLPLLMGAVCVGALWRADPSARWTVPLLTVLTLVSAMLRGGPTVSRIAIAAVCSVTVVFGSAPATTPPAIVAACVGCCYAAMLRWLGA